MRKRLLISAILIELTVTSQAAILSVDGSTCTLADAINGANFDVVVGGCVAGSGDDVIELPVNSLQTLTAGLPDVVSNITINGHNSTITRDSISFFPIFEAQLGGSLTLNDATITGGQDSDDSNSGGGINIFGSTLVMNNCTVSANTGGAVFFINSVSSVISNSVIDNNKGVDYSIYYNGGVNVNGGDVTIQNSTISNNSGDSNSAGGGGVYATAEAGDLTLNIINTTISGNSSYLRGGGLSHNNYGNSSVINLTNVTITGNTTNGVGGGIENDSATINIVQSIIAGNEGSGGSEINTLNDTITLNAYNLIGLNGASGIVGTTVGASDTTPLQSSISAVLDPVLSDNGGFTFTHALVYGSPAIDAVPAIDCELPTDQTGVSRPQDGDNDTVAGCDIGAVEYEFVDLIFLDTFENL